MCTVSSPVVFWSCISEHEVWEGVNTGPKTGEVGAEVISALSARKDTKCRVDVSKRGVDQASWLLNIEY